MWKLTIEDDEGQRTSLDLTLDEYTFGRSEDATVRLTERNVSRRHAVLRNTAKAGNGRAAEGGWVVEDEQSYNGTYVNGERVVEPRPLVVGDVVQLGDYRIELFDAAEEAPPPPDPRQERPDRLVMVIGPTPGHEYPLDGDRVTVGRAEDASVSINHASVSRLHAEIINIGPSRWEVIDQGSSNGIRINGVELRRGIIEPGDALELGDVRLRYVAQGKYFRPAVDISQQLAAVPFEAMSPTATPAASRGGQSSVRTVVAVGAAVGLVIIGAVVMLGGGTGGNASPVGSAAPMATSEKEARVLLKQAKDAAGDDIEFAHKLLKRIPDDSPVRDDADFAEIEDTWAEHMFKKAEATTDLAQKRKLLNEISETRSVSAAKRKRAAQMALDIGPAIDLDKGGPRPPTGVPAPKVTHTGAAATTSEAPPDKTAATATSATPAPVSSGKAKAGKFDESAQKRGLYAKMMSGSATEGDLRMLRAICSTDGDRACRNMAHAKLKELRKKDQ